MEMETKQCINKYPRMSRRYNDILQKHSSIHTSYLAFGTLNIKYMPGLFFTTPKVYRLRHALVIKKV